MEMLLIIFCILSFIAGYRMNPEINFVFLKIKKYRALKFINKNIKSIIDGLTAKEIKKDCHEDYDMVLILSDKSVKHDGKIFNEIYLRCKTQVHKKFDLSFRIEEQDE